MPAFQPTCNITSLLSGTQNPWGSIHRRNCHFQPHNSRQPKCCTYTPVIYPTNYTNTHPSSQPVAPQTQILETVQHPYGIGPSKPVIRIPVTAPITKSEHPKCCAHSGITGPSHIYFDCHCGQPIQVSQIFEVSCLPTILPSILSTLALDFMSYSYSFPSHILSIFKSFILGITMRALL